MGIEGKKKEEELEVRDLPSRISRKIIYEVGREEGIILPSDFVHRILKVLTPIIEENISQTRMSVRLHDYLKTTGI